MNVLSLFDGMSCGQIALNRIGIIPNKYYASEIDKFAQIVSKANYPNTIYLGDVRNVKAAELESIDLLIGGSPCQSFSFAGKRKGMSTKDDVQILTLEHYLELQKAGFEFEGQSYLFWEYMRVLTELRTKNPNVKFLLENVMMVEKWQRILTRAIGINPICINSALVSAQNRRRLYWTNIGAEAHGLFSDLKCMITQPKDRNIFLKDVLESEVHEKYFLSQKNLEALEAWEKRNKEAGNGFKVEIKNDEDKSCALSTGSQKSSSTYVVHNMMPRSSKTGKGGTGHLKREDGKTYCLDTNTNTIEIKEPIQLNVSTESQGTQPYQQNRVYDPKGISPSLMAQMSCGTHAILDKKRIRRLTPIECERLQTVPVNYTNHVSDSQRYRMLGNGWTVDVIAHIFSFMN